MLSHTCKWISPVFLNLIFVGCILADFTCIECDKTDDCLKNVTAIAGTCPNETTACFTKINADGTVSRGCLSKINATDCNAENCVTCNSASCNKNNICKSCNSSNDSKCAQTDASDVKNAICANPNSKCMISVLDSKTERGCVTEQIEKTCTDEKKCKMCDGGICNVGIFPTDRLVCHQCTEESSTCPNAQSSSNSTASLPCLLYVENDKCYIYGSDATHVTRGCTSDNDTTNKCANADDAKCKTCDTNNCNDWGYEMDQPLMCVTCSSNDDAQCIWGQSSSSAKSCEKKILYTDEPKCYTRTDEKEIVTRGCFYDLDEAGQTACAEGKNCTVCTSSNGCNSADAKNFTCIRCRSDINNGCLKTVIGTGAAETCRNLVTSEEDAKCFAGVWNNDLVIRGCFIDLEIRDQFACNNTNNKNCYVCDSANCNTKDPNGAAQLLLSNGLLAFVLFTLWRLK